MGTLSGCCQYLEDNLTLIQFKIQKGWGPPIFPILNKHQVIMDYLGTKSVEKHVGYSTTTSFLFQIKQKILKRTAITPFLKG